MKLNKQMRDAIVKRILEEVKPAREARLRSCEQALVIKLIRHRYGDDVFERCRALPEGWIGVHKAICLDYQLRNLLPRKQIVVGSGRNRSVDHYPRSTLYLAEYAPLPNSTGSGWTREAIGEKLYDELTDLFQAWVDALTDFELLEQQLRATLSSFTTVGRLAADWPEGYVKLPAELTAPEGLPAPRIADLNERIAAVKRAA